MQTTCNVSSKDTEIDYFYLSCPIKVAVVTELTSQGIMQFIVSLCVIIGGLVTVMG